ncbi:MAG: hypothetical protein JNL90_14420 [Planctomycetes bacterium]|nr:hypothetical protein [Planctomycetota bacterium]
MDESSNESIEQFRARVSQRWGHLSSADLDRLCVRRADVRSQLLPHRFVEHVTDARRALESLQRDRPPAALPAAPSLTPWSSR